MKTLRIFLAAVLSAAGFAAQAQAPALSTFAVGTPATTVTVSALAGNFNTIWELVWGPDNFIWMTERYGRISRVNPATGQVLPLLTLPDVGQTSEGGLLGMVLHPDFSTNPYVYVVYNYYDPAGYKEKVVRFTYSAAANTLTAPLVLLGGITAVSTHSGSRLLILPDRTLLMTTGDAQTTSSAQSPTSLNGKILRMNLDGTIPANNPTPGSRLYTLGHRNPQGLVQLANGRIYSSEHGPSTNDEINRIEVGRNYGWPNVEGFCDLAAERTFCAANNVREPLTTWTPTIAPAGLKYYDHPAIPAWRGSLLVCALGGRKLVQMPLDATGNVIATRTDYLSTFGRLRGICVSPQGRIYIGTSNRDGRGTPAATDDRILVLENRSFVSATQPAGALAAAVAVWPNPARHQAQVSLPAGGGSVTLCDLLGRPLRQQTTAGTSVVLELDGLATGHYLVRVAAAAGTITRRLAVN